ncbi:MAG: hemolysin family protein [Bacillus sp. (in: Bacteria)]|nr:hemolysin family protein [Bacillus sp. (in: firmicutes)]
MVPEIIILIILITVNAFFSASEMALISLNDNKVKLMAESGDKKAKMLSKLLSEPSRFLATIQIGITLAGFLASAFAAESFSGPLADILFELGIPISQELLETIAVVAITLLLSYFTLVLGELVPKQLALKKAEAISRFAVAPLTFLSKVSSPFVKLLTISSNLVVRFFGVDPNGDDENVTEEEIRMMIDVGNEIGTIEEDEKVMINNVFEFNNKTVSDIMTHRTKIVALSIDANLNKTASLVNNQKYTRYPVYEGTIDNIIGILHGKDLLQFVGNFDELAFNLRALIREPYYVLESKRTDLLLKELQKKNVHMAVVLDEYGGTDGIVTMEDLIEEIVGNIFDEYDEPLLGDEEIIVLGQNEYLMAGTLNLYEVEEILNIELPTQEYDTLSGFIIGQLGGIPNDTQTVFDYKNILFTVIEMSNKRILKVKTNVKEEVKTSRNMSY